MKLYITRTARGYAETVGEAYSLAQAYKMLQAYQIADMGGKYHVSKYPCSNWK